MNSINIEGKLWINFRYPNCKVADVDYIMKIFNFPQISQRYIFDNWIRINEKMVVHIVNQHILKVCQQNIIIKGL